VHMDPVFHATAITTRRDPLHQSVLHGVRKLGRTDGACLNNISFETHMWRALRAANLEPAALYNVASAPPRCHVRVAIARGVPGQARAVISALFSVPGVKHVTVVDEDVDIFSDEEVEWAVSTRFRADHDLVVAHGFPGVHMDPNVGPDKTCSKIGFDATEAYSRPSQIDTWRPLPPTITGPQKCQTLLQALSEGPRYFHELLSDMGSRDGREIALELNRMYASGEVDRAPNGEWQLNQKA
jgi:2,5-furandicarboxylate decarboxylase 1